MSKKNITSEKVEDITAVTVSASVMANLLSVTDRRIRDLAGEEILVRVGHGRYDLAKSIKNYILHLKTNNDIKETKSDYIDLHREQALHEIIKREKSEIQLKVMKGEVHLADDVEKVMTDMFINFRGKILSLPPKLAPLLISRNDLGEIQETIEKQCLESLQELSIYDPVMFYNEKYVDFEEEEDEIEKNKDKDTETI